MKRAFVDLAEDWRWSSARDYAGLPGLIEVDEYGGSGLGYSEEIRRDKGSDATARPRGRFYQ